MRVTLSSNGRVPADLETFAATTSVEVEVEELPSVSLVLPNKGIAAGGMTVHVYGGGFVDRPGLLRCTFGAGEPNSASGAIRRRHWRYPWSRWRRWRYPTMAQLD